MSACGGSDDGSGSNANAGKDGTELSIGEAASVTFKDDDEIMGGSGKSGKVDIELVSVKKGSSDETDAVADESSKGSTPYYLTFKLTNTGGKDLAGSRVVGAYGLDKDGESASIMSVPEDFAPCPSAPAPENFTSKGAEYETCRVATSESDAEIVGASYAPDGIDSTIVWK